LFVNRTDQKREPIQLTSMKYFFLTGTNSASGIGALESDSVYVPAFDSVIDFTISSRLYIVLIDNTLTINRRNYDRSTCCVVYIINLLYTHDASLHNNSLFIITCKVGIL